jgi:hypothetical protein
MTSHFKFWEQYIDNFAAPLWSWSITNQAGNGDSCSASSCNAVNQSTDLAKSCTDLTLISSEIVSTLVSLD